MFQFIKSFLGQFSNANQSTIDTAISEPAMLTPMPSEALFTDMNAPHAEDSNRKEVKPIGEFLSSDFKHEGRMAGYEHHNLQYLSIGIQELRARFRGACDKHIQVLENDLIEVKTLFIQVGDALPSEQQILQLRIDKINSNVEEIRLQKMLSVENEGFISEAVQSYTHGFHQGLRDYVNESKFNSHDIV
jgi:hypothetical protein